MHAFLKPVLLLGYLTLPCIVVFLSGFGGFELQVEWFFQVFVLSLIALVIYDIVLIVRCLRALVCKRKSPSCIRCVVITGALVWFFISPQFLARPLRKYGAALRLEMLGGSKFCDQLLSEAHQLIAAADEEVTSISREALPQCIQRLGGRFAIIQARHPVQVVIRTSGRPESHGWILVPRGSKALPPSNAVEVVPNIYRY